MNNDNIYQRYMAALTEQQETSPVVRLALRLAIGEAAANTGPRTNTTHPPYIECGRQLDVLGHFLQLRYPKILAEHPDVATAILSLIETLESQVGTRNEQLLDLHRQLDKARADLEEYSLGSDEEDRLDTQVNYHDLYVSTYSSLEKVKGELETARTELASTKAILAEVIIEKQELREEYEETKATLEAFLDSPLPEDTNACASADHDYKQAAPIASLPASPTTNGNGNHANSAPDISKEGKLWWDKLTTGQSTWRYTPKPIQREIVRHILTLGANIGAMTMAEFVAIKPAWMPSPGSLTKTLNTSWPELNRDLPGSDQSTIHGQRKGPDEGPFIDNPELNQIAGQIIANQTSFGRLKPKVKLHLVRHILDKTQERNELEYNRARPNWMPPAGSIKVLLRMSWEQIASK